MVYWFFCFGIFYLSYAFLECFSLLLASYGHLIHHRKKNENFFCLFTVLITPQLELLPSQKLFLTATSVELSCRAASSIDLVFSLKSVRVSCGGKIYAAHYTDLKCWVYEHIHANSLCLHSNVASF